MAKKVLKSSTYSIDLPLPPDEESGWRGFWQFQGHTPNRFWVSCHVSVLSSGSCPHPPHTHDEEEILLLLDGSVDLMLPAETALNGEGRLALKPGQFVYYPMNCPHTLETTSNTPAHYLMLKWSSKKPLVTGQDTKAFGIYTTTPPEKRKASSNGFHSRLLFENPTHYLRKVHSHLTSLEPGGGYAEHVDNHEVVLVMLKGECQTLGSTIKPFDVTHYAAGEPHGIQNSSLEDATYLVFEFHGAFATSQWSKIINRIKSVVSRRG